MVFSNIYINLIYFNNDYRVKKILNTKIFDGENGKKWTASVMDKQYEVLCISQFTLYHIMKGNRLDFHNAMCAHEAELFYKKLLSQLSEDYNPDKIKGKLLLSSTKSFEI